MGFAFQSSKARQENYHFHGINETTTSTTSESGGGMVSEPGMWKPVFVKVDQLKPGTNGHTLTVKVISSDTFLQKKGRNSPVLSRGGGGGVGQSRIAECFVGDETGTILFTARSDQGTTVILRNAKIDMFKGSMRLAVDKWDRVGVTEPVKFVVKEYNNLSLAEYELVNVIEE